jgi:hypothetical protein
MTTANIYKSKLYFMTYVYVHFFAEFSNDMLMKDISKRSRKSLTSHSEAPFMRYANISDPVLP